MTWGTPFWQPPRPAGTTATVPAYSEVVIVGGGITGAALLNHLVASGEQVVLVERDHIAAGASGRNAGFLLTGVADCYATAVRTLGRRVAAEVWAFTADNHDLLLGAVGDAHAAAAGHRREGAWTLAASLEEAALLRESAVLLAEDGLAGEWVEDPPAAPSGHHGGLFVRADGAVDPAAIVGLLAAGAADRIVEGVEVTAVEPGGGGVRVATTAGEIAAAAVIVATNAEAPLLIAGLPIRPVRGQMLATAPVAARLEQRPSYAHHGHRYWRQLRSGEVLVGGWRDLDAAAEVGYDAVPTATIQSHLDSWTRSLGADAEVTHRWAGTMGFTPDGLPLVGAAPGMPGVYVCGGYTGHGMGFAVHAARRLCTLLRDGVAPPPWCSPARFASPGARR